MPHVVVGTAGHIDHGKSSLVRALTGIDPDRLAEEKRRGITIELGFADLDLGSGDAVSFVDVPGHERFVRQMVAGATGIDAVLLVVAADEGVQPQTREHLAICRLLELRRGLIALTKCDLVEPELREVVALEVRELVGGTFLEDAPLIEVSVRQGTGLAELRQALAELARDEPRRSADGLVRLPIDRTFVMHGFGTVVTGTLISGTLREGDEIELLPGGARARVRGLEVHRSKVPLVTAGKRAAVNLQGLDRAQAPRGATLVHPGQWQVTRRLWARVELLPSAPPVLRMQGGPIRLHHGTTDEGGRLRVLEREGEHTLHAELLLARPIVAAPGDAFILRRPAPVDTMGGGLVVDIAPPPARQVSRRAFDAGALDAAASIEERVARSGLAGVELSSVARALGRSVAWVEAESAGARSAGTIVEAGNRWFPGAAWRELERETLASLEAHHRQHPLLEGQSREALRGRLAATLPQEAWRALIEGLAERGAVRIVGENVALASHRIELSGADRELVQRIERAFLDAGLDPPALENLLKEADRARAAPLVSWLLSQGRLVRIQDRRLFHAHALEDLRERLRRHARTSRTIDVGAFKDLAGVTRKNAIPLLEQLDAERSTRRIGNVREILLDPP